MISYTRNGRQVYITCFLHFFLFVSFHPVSFFTCPFIPYLFYFPFQCFLPRILHFLPSFKCSSPILSLASFPPLLSSTFHIPSDWFLCLSNFSSNAARAAFQPTASGAASVCALPMRLRAGKSRKSQVQGYMQHRPCRAWEPRG